MYKKVSVLMILVLVASMLLAACQKADETTEATEAAGEELVITDTELNVLCTPQEEWCQGMKQEFEALYGITVNYVRMSSGEALARIEAEKDAPTLISGGEARSTASWPPREWDCCRPMIPRILSTCTTLT